MDELIEWLEAEIERSKEYRAECDREGYRFSRIAYEGEINALTRVIYHIKGEDQ